VKRQVSTAVTIPTNNAGTRIHGCDDPQFPTLVGGGYSVSPAALVNVTATVNGPTSDGAWQVTIVNTSGQTVTLAPYTMCASG
jgi:hypothetical protein